MGYFYSYIRLWLFLTYNFWVLFLYIFYFQLVFSKPHNTQKNTPIFNESLISEWEVYHSSLLVSRHIPHPWVKSILLFLSLLIDFLARGIVGFSWMGYIFLESNRVSSYKNIQKALELSLGPSVLPGFNTDNECSSIALMRFKRQFTPEIVTCKE